MCKEEIEVLSCAVRKLLNDRESLRNEVKELTEILRVPRKHYKFIEKARNLDELVREKNKILRKSQLSENPSTLTYDTRITE